MDLVSFILCHIHYVLLFSVIKCIKNIKAHRETTFSKQTLCKLETRQSLKCAQLQDRKFKSLMECAFECAKEDSCLGISIDTTSNCYYHLKCSQSFSCDQQDIMFTIYVKGSKIWVDNPITTVPTTIPPCQHNGTWNSTTNVCICNSGWVGQFCERLANSCKELAQCGYPQGWPDGLLWVELQIETYPTPIKVLCELRETYFNTYIMRNIGWTRQRSILMPEYINGFNKSENCFWLGLIKMKAFNDAGHTNLKLDTGFTTSDFNLLQMTYKNFIMGDSSTGFSFTFSTTVTKQEGPESETLKYGDCLAPLKGAKFSAPDYDEDETKENCALDAGAGWWFNNDCKIKCNPLGYKTRMNINGSQTERIIMEGTDCENIDSCMISMYFVMYL